MRNTSYNAVPKEIPANDPTMIPAQKAVMDQIIADEAISELVRLTRKVRLLERRLKSGE